MGNTRITFRDMGIALSLFRWGCNYMSIKEIFRYRMFWLWIIQSFRTHHSRFVHRGLGFKQTQLYSVPHSHYCMVSCVRLSHKKAHFHLRQIFLLIASTYSNKPGLGFKFFFPK